jgi:enoyl-CoA hydratase/carnithine racemase
MDALGATVVALASELKLGAPSVQILIKKLVTQIDALPHGSVAADILGEHVANQSVSEDAREGMSAFLAKRQPKWAT